MPIEPSELPRHFAITSHHVKEPDHRNDRGVGRTQQQEEKDDPDDPPENVSNWRGERRGREFFPDEAQHVFAALLQHDGDVVTVREVKRLTEHRRQREHRPSEQCGSENNFDCYWRDRLERFARNARVFHCRTWIELHYTSEVGNRLRTGECKDDADELHPNCTQTFVARLKEMRGQMWRTNGD